MRHVRPPKALRASVVALVTLALAAPAAACSAPAAVVPPAGASATTASKLATTANPSASAVSAAPSAAASGRAKPSRILLTPTADPSTSQRFSWTMRRRQVGQRVQVRRPGGSARSVSAQRRPKTTTFYAGTNDPRYAATVSGLRPDTPYEYRIVVKGGATPWRTFTTAGGEDVATTIVALGDTQIDNRGVPRATVAAATAAEPDADLVLQAGDVVDRPYRDGQWGDLFAAMGNSGRTRNWLVAIGNHEQCVLLTGCRSMRGQAFRSYFDWPTNGFANQGETWFYTDYQDVRVVVLDTFGGRLPDQARFLDSALASNPNRWSIVLMHAGPFATRPGRSNDDVRALLLPVIEAHHVDLVLSGHDHSYARGQRDPAGTVFAVSVSGPKYYEVADADWVSNGAQRDVWAAQTSTYQVIDIDGDRLDYRAVVTAKGGGTTTSVPVGGVLDRFSIVKSGDSKVVR